MTREKFIETLEKNRYSYEIVGDKIVVTHRTYINLRSLQTIPPGVEFRNGADVWLESLETLPPGVKFENGGSVGLHSLETLPPGVKFNNRGDVHLKSLKTIPPGVEFNNRGDSDLGSLAGGWFDEWDGNIKRIAPNRILNKMIEDGLFDRR